MIRVVIENIFLFLLPSLIYITFRFVRQSSAGEAGKLLDDAPFVTLFAAGASLVVLTLIVFGSRVGGDPRQGYQPPVLTDHGIESGRIK